MVTKNSSLPSPRATPRPEQFTVGWICVLEAEYRAALAILDEKYDDKGFVRGDGDENNYVLGRAGSHNVTINMPPAGWQGQVHASRISLDMRSSFPRLRFVLLVGIAGGVPFPEDIRLGDVVIGTQVFPFASGKNTQFGVQQTGVIRAPPRGLLEAITLLMQRFWEPESLLLSESIQGVLTRAGRGGDAFARPEEDSLFRDNIAHNGDQCDCRQTKPPHRNKLQDRSDREGDIVKLFQGCIGSENIVMKNAKDRDDIASEMDILCYEMEATSVMDCGPCLPIRGIADYADAHKNDKWHLYAALSAATCARELLLSLSPEFVSRLPLNVCGEVVDRYMNGAISNPNLFSGSEIEKLRKTHDNLMDRYKFLQEVRIEELQNNSDESLSRQEKRQRLQKFKTSLDMHLEHLNQILENHLNELTTRSDPKIQEEYQSLKIQFRKEKALIEGGSQTVEAILKSMAFMPSELSDILKDRGLGIAGVVLKHVGEMLERWRSSPMSPTALYQWVSRKTWMASFYSSRGMDSRFLEMGRMEMGAM